MVPERTPRTARILLGRLALVLLATVPVSAQEEVTARDLEYLLNLETDAAEIVTIIEQASALDLLEEEIEELAEGGADELVLDAIRTAIRRNPVNVILRMRAAGREESEIIAWIHEKIPTLELGAKDKLRLFRAELSEDIADALEGRYVLPGFAKYEDPLGFLSIQYPQEWSAFEFYDSAGLWIVLSPERGVEEPNDFTTGLQIQFAYWHGEPPADVLEWHVRTMDSWIASNQAEFGVARIDGPEGEPVAMRLSGVDAVRQTVLVRMKDTKCKEHVVQAVEDGTKFFMEGIAPEAEFENRREVFETMLDTCRLFPRRMNVARAATPMPANEILQRFKESVVQIRTETGYGSGFFVRDDGLVLTNHHVVCARDNHVPCADPANMQLARNIEILWDATVGPTRPGEARRTVRAELLDTVYFTRPHADLALLRAARSSEPYEALPWSPARNGLTRIGDPVVAIGFPKPSSMGEGNIFQTEGTVATIRYVSSPLSGVSDIAALDDLMTSAEINGGNSGGPCINLHTGSVVGLNTYTPLTLTGQELDYAGVCLIDHALYHFPQIRWYPRDGLTSAELHLELADSLLTRGNFRAAKVELDAAGADPYLLDPGQRANLRYGYARYYQSIGDQAAYEQSLRQALYEDDSHTDSLVASAYLAMSRGDGASALLMGDKLVADHPGDYEHRYYRAGLYRLAGRPEDAMADLGAALELGGDFDANVHALRGRLHLDGGDVPSAKASYEWGIRETSTCVDCYFGLADCFLAEGNEDAALIEISRCLEQNPDRPEVLGRYGRYLRDRLGRSADAIDPLSKAIVLARSERGRPAREDCFALLRSVEDLAPSGDDPLLGLVFHVAGLIHDHYPDARSSAHTWFAWYWNQFDRSGLTRAHYLAAGDTRADELPAAAFTLADVRLMLQLAYSVELFGDVVGAGSLGFFLSDQALASLGELLTPGHVMILLSRSVSDQMLGSADLAAGAAIEFTGDYIEVGDDAAYGRYRLTNGTPLPLCNLVLRYTFLDGEARVLTVFDELVDYRVLASGESLETDFYYPSWESLEQRGIGREEARRFVIRVVSACNAAYLGDVRVTRLGSLPEGVELDVTSVSPMFRMTDLEAEIAFLDGAGAPILHESGGWPLTEVRSFPGSRLEPGTTQTLLVADWVNLDYLRSIGMPVTDDITFQIRVVGASIEPAF